MLGGLPLRIRTFGWADTAWLGVRALLRRVSRGSVRLSKYYFVAQPVAREAALPAHRSGVHLYVADTLDDVVAQAPLGEAALRERFARGSRCIVAARGGTLAGFIWLAPTPYHEEAVRCRYRWSPAAAAAWDYDVYIAPHERMGRLFGRLWARAHVLLAAQGVRWTLSYIDAFNPGSLAAHRRLGARVVARGWFLVAGGWQLSVATVAPYVHLSRPHGAGPMLCFDLVRLVPGALPSHGRAPVSGPAPGVRAAEDHAAGTRADAARRP